MPRLIRSLSALAVVAAVGACAPAEPAPDPAADRAAIDALRSEWAAAYNAGDAARLGVLYTSDAVLMDPFMPEISGPAAIQQSFAERLSQASINATVTPSETVIMGDWAFDRGTYAVTATPMMDGAEAMTEQGKYLVLLRRDADGSWKIAREIGNPSTPPPGMEMPGMPMAEGGMGGQ